MLVDVCHYYYYYYYYTCLTASAPGLVKPVPENQSGFK